MAEFTEVMRQAKRMCADRSGICSYSNCLLDNEKECRLNIDLDGEDYNEPDRNFHGRKHNASAGGV